MHNVEVTISHPILIMLMSRKISQNLLSLNGRLSEPKTISDQLLVCNQY